jgi:hypothetical protein
MNTHEDLSRREEARGSSDRSFGLVFAGFFTLVGLLPLLRHHKLRPWALVVAGIFLVVAIARPSLLHIANRLWTQLGVLMSRVVNPIVMGLLFYGIVTPIAMLRRMSGRDDMKRHYDPNATSYWLERRPPGPTPDSMARQF